MRLNVKKFLNLLQEKEEEYGINLVLNEEIIDLQENVAEVEEDIGLLKKVLDGIDDPVDATDEDFTRVLALIHIHLVDLKQEISDIHGIISPIIKRYSKYTDQRGALAAYTNENNDV